MTEVPGELRQALDADESCDLDEIIRQHRPADFEALRSLLADPAAGTLRQTRAIYALGRWGDPAAVKAIRDLLPGLGYDGRITAIDALGRLGTEEAVNAILEYANDESLPMRKFVSRALARIGTPRARAALSGLQRDDSSHSG